MISIKHFLSQKTETDQTPMHVVRRLVQGIGLHAAGGDIADCERFRESIRQTLVMLVDGITPEDLLVRTGSVLNELERHNRQATRQQHLQKAELQNMVKMLTSAVGNITAASKTSISTLCDIEKHVALASELDDVRLIKAKLSECLMNIQNEATRQQTETAETIQQLREGLDRIRPNQAPLNHDARAGDPVTGLPLRPDAELALADAARSGTGNFAAVMILERIQILNARFGREAVDEMLVEFVRMVEKSLNPGDGLFRWGGPVIVALITRRSSPELARREIGRIMETRLEHTIQTASRSVLIPVTARWCVFPMMAAPRLLFQKVDEFAARPAAQG